MRHARLPRAVRLLHQASSAGLGRSRQPWADKSHTGHPLGQSVQGSHPPPPVTARIITEPRAVSQTLHRRPLSPSGAHWLDDPPDLSCKESTGQHPVDGCQLSCKQLGLTLPRMGLLWECPSSR
jgi:hypothetical protein